MKNMSKATEQRIVEALEKAVKLANDGATPDAALTKVANDYEFQPEIIKRMVEAFNVSKTLAHLKNANEEERANSFPLANIEAILGELYPAVPETPATKAASALHDSYTSPDRVNLMEMSKSAKQNIELPPLTEKKAEAYARDPNAIAREAIQNQDKLEKLHKQAKDAYRHTYLKFFEVLDKAAAHWRKLEGREPFDLVEKRAVSTFGPLGKIAMDMIYEHGDLKQAKLQVKRAAADELGTQQMHFDDSASPYTEVSDLVFLSRQIDRLLKESAAIEQVKHQHALLNKDLLPPQPVMRAIDYGVSRVIEKEARDMPSFTKQDRPKKVKEIYKALKRDHPGMSAKRKAQIAESTHNKMSCALDELFVKE